MPYSSPESQREYQRKWVARRRAEWISAQGGLCRKCGSRDDLEVDHVNPEFKTMEPRDIWSRKESVRHAELKLCQVLCRRCHAEKTRKQFLSPCGTESSYSRGCRCGECRAANTLKRREYRARCRAGLIEEKTIKPAEHGSTSKYSAGCRCSDCKAASAAYSRQRYARAKALRA